MELKLFPFKTIREEVIRSESPLSEITCLMRADK